MTNVTVVPAALVKAFEEKHRREKERLADTKRRIASLILPEVEQAMSKLEQFVREHSR